MIGMTLMASTSKYACLPMLQAIHAKSDYSDAGIRKTDGFCGMAVRMQI